MDISALQGVSSVYSGQISPVDDKRESTDSFQSFLKAAMNMVNETNQLENNAEAAEIQFALGEAVNIHDLQIAQKKANIALQYTVAVRDKVMEAYKEIMNMSI